MTPEFDVCVAGGGPAGAAAATSLARLGYRVAVLAQPAQAPLGESLSPGVWPVLDALGLDRAVVRSVGLRVREAGVRWRTADEDRLPVQDGLTVDRARFDALLLEQAQSAGATVVRARAHRPVRTAGGWRVPHDGGAVEARFLVDATGRRRLLGGRRRRTSARMVALHARWPTRWPADGPQTRIAALAEGWLWCAELPGGDVRAMVFVDPEWLAGTRAAPDRLFGQQFLRTPEIAAALGPLPPSVPVQVCDATSYRLDRVADLDSIRVGEAAFGIDPLSSSGVQTAIQTGLASAATVHSVLSSDGDAAAGLEYYEDLVRASVTHHARTASRLYAEHRQFAAEPFWRRRSEADQPAPTAPTFPPVPLAELLRQPVQLRPPARLELAPCRVGDRIVRRPALTSPELDRPVAFLAGTSLAPLIEEIEAASSLAEALRQWVGTMPPERASAILAWLTERRLLEVKGRGSDPASL